MSFWYSFEREGFILLCRMIHRQILYCNHHLHRSIPFRDCETSRPRRERFLLLQCRANDSSSLLHNQSVLSWLLRVHFCVYPSLGSYLFIVSTINRFSSLAYFKFLLSYYPRNLKNHKRTFASGILDLKDVRGKSYEKVKGWVGLTAIMVA